MAVPPQPPPARPPSTPTASGTGDRLDSWKEIAQFLKRDVRTVQRWEKYAGLPVHRHAESRLRTAYAYRSELEAWWRMHDTTFDTDGRPSPKTATERDDEPLSSPALRVRVSRIFLTTVLFAVVVAALAALASYRRRPLPVTAAERQPPVTVLLTGFENRTGEEGIGALLDELLRKELASDDALDVVPPARVARVLVLMRRDPSLPLTESIGREVGARDDGINLVLAGTVRRVGNAYLVSIRVIDPVDGQLRAAVARQAIDIAQLMTTVRDEAAQIRDRIFKPAPIARRGRERFEEVTTRSLAAVRLYTQAVRAGRRRQWAASELLARRAIEVDDRFASAYAWTAWAMRNQGRPTAECLPLAERAVALSVDTTDRERYFIHGTQAHLADDMDGAVAAYEALLRLKPDDTRVMDLLIDCYARGGRMVDAVQRAVARANAEPEDFYANVRAARALTIWHRDAQSAQPFLERSQRLVSHQTMSERPFWSAWLTLLPGFERWLNNDLQGLLETVARVEPDIENRIGRERDGLSTAVGFSYLAAGRLGQAEAAFRNASTPVRQINLAMLAVATSDRLRARHWLEQIREHSRERPALFAYVGLLDEAERGIGTYFGAEHGAGVLDITRGLILLGRGRSAEAIAPLRHGLDLLRYSGEPEYFWDVDALSRVWLERHDARRAEQILEEATRQRPRTYGSAQWSGAEWIRTAAALAALYDSSHRPVDAARVRMMIAPLLRFADPGHPLAVSQTTSPQS